MYKQIFMIVAVLIFAAQAMGAPAKKPVPLHGLPAADVSGSLYKNDPVRCEEFMDWGLGMFVHWSMDSQLGCVISHSMVGASDDYLDKFINDLPKTFNPENYDPEEWMKIAKLAGVKYMVLTSKHHSGFCMWDTKTNDFNITKTLYKKDILKSFVKACRKYDIKVGFYFSPEDFYFLHKQDHIIRRKAEYADISNNKELLDYNKKQMKELLTKYGKIDIVFLDAFDNELMRQYIHQVQPECLVTRGEMATPEQKMPDAPMPGPWEANFTLGNQWQYKPTNEQYKSGTKLIEMLIEIRAKGGNFLLNVGPQPDGVIPFEQKRRFRELALWNFINGEAIYEIRPWHIIREGDIWFTKAKNSDTVYAFLTKIPNWQHGSRKEFTLKSVRASEKSVIEVLGQSSKVVEYQPENDPEATWKQDDQGLHISVVRAQRIYNNRRWPNPIVVKITHAKRP